MIVAVQSWDLHLPGCHSLKDKRSVLKPLMTLLTTMRVATPSVLKPLTNGLRKALNVSVAETGHQDAWQRAEIACAVVGTARPVVDEVLRAADRAVEDADGVRIVDTVTEYR